ncbi:hypothetical protein [Photobacterium sp. SKA34]|uniref:hypothetical protein n=1 Tax=Photobacterium sp. SKA34 TaxID=121723 RepID=UPI0005875992|nr:hypothetical protein [Photobacterium sp. SKA34]
MDNTLVWNAKVCGTGKRLFALVKSRFFVLLIITRRCHKSLKSYLQPDQQLFGSILAFQQNMQVKNLLQALVSFKPLSISGGIVDTEIFTHLSEKN